MVTDRPLSEQLSSNVDETELVAAPPPAGRLTTDVHDIVLNGAVRRAAARLTARVTPDLVYQRHRIGLVAGAEVARACSAPLVLEWNFSETWTRSTWEAHRRIDAAFAPSLRFLERRVLRRAALTAAVSEAAAENARELGAPADTIAVVPNAVDIAEVDRHIGLDEGRSGADRHLIGWIGTFGPWHGAEVLVQALALLPESAHAVLVGDGGGREACEELARSLGVWERVRWTGAVPHRSALRLLHGCDVLASPHVPIEGTRFFGSPTKLFEYMALDRPIVASRLEQIGDVLEDGVTARLVRPGDPADLARAIEEVLEDSDRGAELAARARGTAEESHTWDARVRTIVDGLARARRA
jgi:glycosyltransferase involved in cell wall biosynthesis